jgi:hypothetical protein
VRVALDELPAVKVWGLRTAGLIWAGDTERRDRSWRLCPDGDGGRDADEERRGSLASPVPWMRAARQSSAVAWRVRCLLSVLRGCGPVVSPPGPRGGTAGPDRLQADELVSQARFLKRQLSLPVSTMSH